MIRTRTMKDRIRGCWLEAHTAWGKKGNDTMECRQMRLFQKQKIVPKRIEAIAYRRRSLALEMTIATVTVLVLVQEYSLTCATRATLQCSLSNFYQIYQPHLTNILWSLFKLMNISTSWLGESNVTCTVFQNFALFRDGVRNIASREKGVWCKSIF